tara:strand:+ start:2204 stop:2509 length:306 start_codon:yes stop_codon:yes gene_type:complete
MTNATIVQVVDNTPLPQDKKDQAVKILTGYWGAIGTELTEMVERKHKLPQTTQYNYGSYLELLSWLTDAKVELSTASLLLIIAGADARGIKSAVKIILGEI